MAKTLTEKFESERKECVTSEDFLRLINRWRNIQGENVVGVEYSRKAMQCRKKCKFTLFEAFKLLVDIAENINMSLNIT